MSEKEFRERVLSLQRQMYGLALRTGLPPDDAADAVQETQLRLWRGREGIPDLPQALKAYCLTALRNECISQLRKRRESSPLEEIGASGSEEDILVLETNDTRTHIERIIDTLPQGQKQVIRMSSFAGFDVSEIAEATGYSPGNVRQLLSRGRKRIRELLDDLL